METNDPGLAQQTRLYFLQQGRSIHDLYNLLDSNGLTHHLRRWLSLFMEIFLYCFFAILIAVVACTPTDPQFYFDLDGRSGISVGYHHDDIEMAIIAVKVLIIFLSVPILLFALLMRRNRKKGYLIYKAFIEVRKMKDSFDTAIKELKL